MAKAAVWRWGCHGDRLLSEADTQGSVVVPVRVTAPLSDVGRLLLGYAASESSSGSPPASIRSTQTSPRSSFPALLRPPDFFFFKHLNVCWHRLSVPVLRDATLALTGC